MLASLLTLTTSTASAGQLNLGEIAFAGDSITQGGQGHPSYRYELFRRLTLAGEEFRAVGSIQGAYLGDSGPTPDVNDIEFNNVHEAHWGQVSQFLANRLGSILRERRDRDGSIIEPLYGPDTAVLMIGINELAIGDPSVPDVLLSDVRTIVGHFRTANPSVNIYLMSVLPLGSQHPTSSMANPVVGQYNAMLNEHAPSWSTQESPVVYVNVYSDFDPDTLLYDSVHPNPSGEAFIAARLHAAFIDAVEVPEPTTLLHAVIGSIGLWCIGFR